MIEIINKIFIHHGFELIENGDSFGSYYSLIDNNYAYYWLVVNVENIDDVLEKQDQWFKECKSEIDSPDFNKNTSLLILNNYQENFDKWRKKVFSIEEDPYQFKKYVLRFTDEIVSELKENSQDGNSEKLIELMTDKEVFNSYKANHRLGEYSWYDLLYGLANKLPFLNLGVKKEDGIGNLFDDTKSTFEEKGILNDYTEYETKFNKEVMESIDNMELEDLLIILNESNDE